MIANFVVFQLKPGARGAFVEASLANSRGSIDGLGCLATSIIADPVREDVAYVSEVFADQAAFENHHDQAYYRQWLTDTSGLMAKPYEMLQSTTFPDDASLRHLRLAVCGDPNPAAWAVAV